MISHSTEPHIHVSVIANDEDQCQQAKRQQRGKSERGYKVGRKKSSNGNFDCSKAIICQCGWTLSVVGFFIRLMGCVRQWLFEYLIFIQNDSKLCILTAFKKNALLRAHDFDLVKILPMYEQIYFDLVGKSQ